MKKVLMFLLSVSILPTYAAVHLSQDGRGQAISFPFYSLSPNINTYLTINNHTDQPKALKVHIKESKGLTVVKSFNLYLRGQDMWSMVMGSIDEKMYAIGPDFGSCAMGIRTSGGLERLNIPLPVELDWWEWQTGTIEVVEMGEITSDVAAELFIDNSTEPCANFEEAWSATGVNNPGRWQNDANDGLKPASGGVSGSLSMLDVANGFSFSYEPLVFAGFHESGTVMHREPSAAEPNLASGTHTSLVLHDGQVFNTVWPTGYEAISALLMKTTLENNFELSEAFAGKTEWVVSFPTLSYHQNAEDTTIPFSFIQDNPAFPGFIKFPPFPTNYGEDAEVLDGPGFGCIGTISCAHSKSAAVFTYSLYRENTAVPEESVLAGIFQQRPEYAPRKNHELIRIGNGAFNENGKVLFDLYELGDTTKFSIPNNRGRDAVTGQPHVYYGLPATGFVMTQYFNANAQPGLLASYAKTHAHSGERRIEVSGDE